MAEVIGVIAGAIGILSVTAEIYESIQEIRGLPQAFREVGDKIPLVIDTLKQVRAAARRAPEDRRAVITNIVSTCERRAKTLYLILGKLQPYDESTALFDLDRYVSTIRSWGKKGRVEDLLKKILEDVTLLVQNHAVNSVGEEQIRKLSQALEHVSAVEPSAPDDMLEASGGIQISHGGTGDQYNQLGDGNVNNANHGAGNFHVGDIHHHGPGKWHPGEARLDLR
jgi:hypothetical protein